MLLSRYVLLFFFFFKQKTAYEMRISDWSSDVCSSDLLEQLKGIFPGRLYVELQRHGWAIETKTEEAQIDLAYALDLPLVATNDCYFSDEGMYEEIGRAHV